MLELQGRRLRELVEERGVAAIPVSAFYTEDAVKTVVRFCFAKHDATLVGFSLGTGELARYIGTHGTGRLRACVFIESLAPSFAKSARN